MSQKWADYVITGVSYERTGQNKQWKRIVEVKANPDNGEFIGRGINTKFPEIPFDGFPCAARGNSHFFMVIAIGTA